MRRALLGASAVLLTACGGTTAIPQAVSQTPFALAAVEVTQTGGAAARLDRGSVEFRLDNAGLLVITGRVTSTASQAETVTARASLYGPHGGLVGDAEGGDVGVPAGASQPITLNGPRPTGTIASAVIEVSAVPTPG